MAGRAQFFHTRLAPPPRHSLTDEAARPHHELTTTVTGHIKLSNDVLRRQYFETIVPFDSGHTLSVDTLKQAYLLQLAWITNPIEISVK